LYNMRPTLYLLLQARGVFKRKTKADPTVVISIDSWRYCTVINSSKKSQKMMIADTKVSYRYHDTANRYKGTLLWGPSRFGVDSIRMVVPPKLFCRKSDGFSLLRSTMIMQFSHHQQKIWSRTRFWWPKRISFLMGTKQYQKYDRFLFVSTRMPDWGAFHTVWWTSFYQSFSKDEQKNMITPPPWGTREERFFMLRMHINQNGTETMLPKVFRRKSERCKCTKRTVVLFILFEEWWDKANQNRIWTIGRTIFPVAVAQQSKR